MFQFHLYGDKLEKLHENIPPEILPEEFGGRLPPFSNTVSVAGDFFLSFFFVCLTTVLFHWDFSHGKIRLLLSQGKPAATESLYRTYGACGCLSVSIIR